MEPEFMAASLVVLSTLVAVAAANLLPSDIDSPSFQRRQDASIQIPPGYGRVYTAVGRYDISPDDGNGPGIDRYVLYTGNGSSFPPISSWISFSAMWNNYLSTMLGSCTQFSQPNPSLDELKILYNAIQRVALTSFLDHRFILAVVLQESSGCVRAPTTNYGVRNPGLMQDHDGAWSCNDKGIVLNPCPYRWISNMIDEGCRGTSSGDGLVQCVNGARLSWLYKPGAIDFYVAARMYNSGSYQTGCLECGYATHCYVSDIANRLTGWVHAPHNCNLDSQYPEYLAPPAGACTIGSNWGVC